MIGWFLLRTEVYDFLRCIFLFGPKPEILSSSKKLIHNTYIRPLVENDLNPTLLQEEHTRIFTNPRSMTAPPYASFYLSASGTLNFEVIGALKKTYLEHGFALWEKTLTEDHVGVELEFLHMLAAQILQEKSSKKVKQSLKEQLDFLQRHVIIWTPPFCQAIRRGAADGSFYSDLASMFEKFVRDDVESLRQFLNEP